jgi:hypothetical protein
MLDIPEFELNDPAELRGFLQEHRVQISLLTFDAIKKALSEDLLYMPVMKLKIHDMPLAVITVRRENFDESLNKCLLNFQEAEMYELCAEILHILKETNGVVE